MPSDQHTDNALPKNPSAPESPEWLYDEIMRHVEPALMTNRIKESIKRMDGESPENFAARLKHYEEAKHVFVAVAGDIGQILERDGTLAHEAIEHMREDKERQEDEGEVKNIEQLIGDDSAPA